MANEFMTCPDCLKDNTRCQCYKNRPPTPKPPTIEERIKENRLIIIASMAELRRMKDEG